MQQAKIIISQNNRRPLCATILFNKCALDTIGMREILITEKDDEIIISRPKMESKKVFIISKTNNRATFSSKIGVDKIIGEYIIDTDIEVNIDEFCFIKLKS